MMYCIDGTLRPLSNGEIPPQNAVIVKIIKSNQYEEILHEAFVSQQMRTNLKKIHNCKVDMMRNCIIGTFLVPNFHNPLEECESFAFYLKDNVIYFVDDTDTVQNIIDHLVSVQVLKKTMVAHFLFEFMEYLIKDDIAKLQEYDEGLDSLEEDIVKNVSAHYEMEILQIRKKLSVIYTYYQQLSDMSDSLCENYNGIFSEDDCRLFNFYSKRVNRLCRTVQGLKEYAEQIKSMYETRVSNRQNKIMQVLTVVTTVFMPLTLITGWYGMNFVNMPELGWSNGYFVVIVISVIIIIAELILFKVKNWWK